MKRLWFLFFLMCLLPELHADHIDRAQKVLSWIKEGQADSLVARFHPDTRSSLPPSAISKIWLQLEKQAGQFIEMGEWQTEQRDTLLMDQCQLIFEKENVRFVLLTDTNQYIVRFHFNPLSQSLPRPVEQAPVKDYVERDTFLTHGRIRLPATLCLPAQTCHKVPAVVLVHGLGPVDKDGTLGPNKPYSEVAHKFASKGIATLRYDKRTFVYGARSTEIGSQLTFDTEVVEDAIEALRLVAHCNNIDNKRIYLLGHSLGGMLAPRIAMLSDTPISGIIMVSAPARKLEDWLRSQIQYIAKIQGSSEDEADSMTQMVYQRLPEPYRIFADQYNQIGTARGLHLPMLLLQGGHDFQLQKEDFELWKKGLEGFPNTHFVWLENCDHLLREIPEMAVPEIYMRPGSIAQEALDAVVKFIKP